jgi:hypothetical protein
VIRPSEFKLGREVSAQHPKVSLTGLD